LNIKSYNDQIICNLAAGKTLDIDLIFNWVNWFDRLTTCKPC